LHRRKGGAIDGTHLGRPTADVEVLPWGVRAATLFPEEPGANHVRTNIFVMPCVGNIPAGPRTSGPVSVIHTIWQVPRDDETEWRFDIMLDLSGPLDERARQWNARNREELGPDLRKIANLANDYLIDRTKQQLGQVYCGIDARFHVQDACVT